MREFLYELYKWYLLHTRSGKGRLVHSLLMRKEYDGPFCLDCGLCCLHCEAYDKNLKKCLIWVDARRVFRCDMYPLVPYALVKDGLVGKCRYYWE